MLTLQIGGEAYQAELECKPFSTKIYNLLFQARSRATEDDNDAQSGSGDNKGSTMRRLVGIKSNVF